jgi:hypothetical protein
LLEIAQPAVNKFAAGRARGTTEIALLGEHDLQTSPSRVTRDTGAIDATADDEQVRFRVRLPQPNDF